MSATQRDGTQPKGSQQDTRSTAGSPSTRELPNPTEEPTMNLTESTRRIEATLARMALVRRHVLSVNGAYRHAPSEA